MVEMEGRTMLVIGLTGGIASGKGVVEQVFREMNVPVMDADDAAKEAVEPGKPAWQDLHREFGAIYFQENGELDRKRLRQLVFENPGARLRLNNIVHPRVFENIENRLADLARQGHQLAVVSAPLLLETGMQHGMDQVWLVACEPETQIERLIARDKVPRSQAEAVLKAQMPLDEKRRHADVVIDNNGRLSDTRRRVRQRVSRLMEAGRKTEHGQPEQNHG